METINRTISGTVDYSGGAVILDTTSLNFGKLPRECSLKRVSFNYFLYANGDAAELFQTDWKIVGQLQLQVYEFLYPAVLTKSGVPSTSTINRKVIFVDKYKDFICNSRDLIIKSGQDITFELSLYADMTALLSSDFQVSYTISIEVEPISMMRN